MMRKLCFLSVLAFFLAVMPLSAQNRPAGNRGEHRASNQGRSLLVNINAVVLDENKTVVWSQTENKTAIPGRPVGINLVGSNVVVVIQFTPFIRRGGNVLVVQGQIWVEDPEKGITYFTSIQTIPMEFGEPIHFFPLGSSAQSNSSIEIIFTVNPNIENNAQ